VATALQKISRLLSDTTTSFSGGKLHWQRLALLTAAILDGDNRDI